MACPSLQALPRACGTEGVVVGVYNYTTPIFNIDYAGNATSALNMYSTGGSFISNVGGFVARNGSTMRTIHSPKGGQYYGGATSSPTGAIVIKNTNGTASSTAMIQMTVRISDYDTSADPCLITVYWYWYNPGVSWTTKPAIIQGNNRFNNLLRLAKDASGYQCLIIGDTTTSYAGGYISVDIVNVVLTYNGATSIWEDGWNISFVTDISAYTNIQTLTTKKVATLDGVILNQNTAAQTANCWINGTSRAAYFVDNLSGYTIRSQSGYTGFFTDTGLSTASSVKMGSLVISNSYSDTAPTNGLYVKGQSSLTGTVNTANGIQMAKASSASSGAISYYSTTYKAWTTYMAQAGTTTNGVNGNITAPTGTIVTSWGLRNFIESSAGFGFTWEVGTNTGNPTGIIMELNSNTGQLRLSNLAGTGTRLVTTGSTGIFSSISTLTVDTGGTGATSLTGVVLGNGTSAMTALASSTPKQLLRRNDTNTGYEWWTPNYVTDTFYTKNGTLTDNRTVNQNSNRLLFKNALWNTSNLTYGFMLNDSGGSTAGISFYDSFRDSYSSVSALVTTANGYGGVALIDSKVNTDYSAGQAAFMQFIVDDSVGYTSAALQAYNFDTDLYNTLYFGSGDGASWILPANSGTIALTSDIISLYNNNGFLGSNRYVSLNSKTLNFTDFTYDTTNHFYGFRIGEGDNSGDKGGMSFYEPVINGYSSIGAASGISGNIFGGIEMVSGGMNSYWGLTAPQPFMQFFADADFSSYSSGAIRAYNFDTSNYSTLYFGNADNKSWWLPNEGGTIAVQSWVTGQGYVNGESGSYTPTISGSDTYIPSLFYFTRNDRVVHVAGSIQVNGITSLGVHTLTIELPIPITVSSAGDVTGVVSGSFNPSLSSLQRNFITAYFGLNEAAVNFTTDDSDALVFVQFTYIIQ